MRVYGMRYEIITWSPRQESNLYLALRRHSFYPLNYEEAAGDCRGWADRMPARWDQS